MKFGYLTRVDGLADWAKRLVTDLNASVVPLGTLPGPYTNDAAAASAGIQVGQSYMDTAGIYRRRLT